MKTHYLIIGLVIAGITTLFTVLTLLPPSDPPGAGTSSTSANQTPGAATPANEPGQPGRQFARIADEPRGFEPLTPDQRIRLARLEQAFWAAPDDSSRIELLRQLEDESYGTEALDFLGEILRGEKFTYSDQVHEAVIAILSGNTSVEILPVLSIATAQESPDTRELALMASGHVRSPKVAEFLGQSVNDPSALVRMTVLDAVEKHPSGTKEKVWALALGSEFDDLALAAIDEVNVHIKKNRIPILIEAANSPNRKVRAQALQDLTFILGQRFDDAGSASSWWSQNAANFDSDLVEK